MTQQRRTALKELQILDTSIQDARERIKEFDPLFEEIEEPALALESQLGTGSKRLKEMKLEEARLELSSQERRERIKRLDERLGAVRNLREEAAVSAELDMVKRGLENDETEALTLIDQVRKGEERVAELEEAHKEASALVEPKKEALLKDREDARSLLAGLEKERTSFTAAMDANELRIYEAIRGGGRRAAISELTEDGACGNCFGIVPLQHQNEIRHGETLIRCEACGVILAAPEPVEEGAEVEVSAEADATDESGEDTTAADHDGEADEAEPAEGETAAAAAADEGDSEE